MRIIDEEPRRRWWHFRFRAAEQPKPKDCPHAQWTKWKPWGAGWYFQRRSCLDCGFMQEKSI